MLIIICCKFFLQWTNIRKIMLGRGESITNYAARALPLTCLQQTQYSHSVITKTTVQRNLITDH